LLRGTKNVKNPKKGWFFLLFIFLNAEMRFSGTFQPSISAPNFPITPSEIRPSKQINFFFILFYFIFFF